MEIKKKLERAETVVITHCMRAHSCLAGDQTQFCVFTLEDVFFFFFVLHTLLSGDTHFTLPT